MPGVDGCFCLVARGVPPILSATVHTQFCRELCREAAVTDARAESCQFAPSCAIRRRVMWRLWRALFSAWLPWHLFLLCNYAEVERWRGEINVQKLPRRAAFWCGVMWSLVHSSTFWFFPMHLNFHTCASSPSNCLPFLLPHFRYLPNLPGSLSSSHTPVSGMPTSWVIGPESNPLRPLRKTSGGRGSERKGRNKEWSKCVELYVCLCLYAVVVVGVAVWGWEPGGREG